MKMKRIWCLACVLLLSWWAVGSVQARSAEEERLEKIQADLDQDVSPEGRSMRAEALVTQFNTTQEEIEALRSANRGWGEITIQLSLAERLLQAKPELGDLSAAIKEVGALRDEGMGWGNVAKELGVSKNLGEVVGKVERTRETFEAAEGARVKSQAFNRTNARLEKAARAETKGTKAERPQKVHRVERIAGPDRPVRPERPLRPERPNH